MPYLIMVVMSVMRRLPGLTARHVTEAIQSVPGVRHSFDQY